MSGSILVQQPDGSWARLLTNINGDVNTLRTDNVYLVAPGYTRMSVTRSMTPGTAQSWVPDAGGVWRAYGQNTPRQSADGGLLVEPEGGNQVRNPRGEGGTLGVSTAPDWWAVFASNGLTTTLIGRGTLPDGRPYADLWIRGTTTSTFYVFAFDTAGGAPVTPGAAYTETVGLAVVGGSLANVSSCVINLRWSSGAQSYATIVPTSSVTDYRVTGIAPAGTTTANPALLLNFASGVAIDLTLRVVLPQLEPGAVTTSRITPGTGTTGATLRGQALPSIALSTLPSIAGGFCVYGTWRLIDLLGSSTSVLVQIDDGGASNIVRIEKNAASGLSLLRTTGGAQSSIGAGTALAGTPQRWAIYGDSAGTVRARVDAGAPVQVTGAPLPSAMTTLRIGIPGFGPLGTFPHMRLVPRTVSDAEALALMSSLPL